VNLSTKPYIEFHLTFCLC